MIAIDTNVLVRILVDDPDAPEQCQQARDLVSSEKESVWIAQIVLVETVWVLESCYQFRKPTILGSSTQYVGRVKINIR